MKLNLDFCLACSLTAPSLCWPTAKLIPFWVMLGYNTATSQMKTRGNNSFQVGWQSSRDVICGLRLASNVTQFSSQTHEGCSRVGYLHCHMLLLPLLHHILLLHHLLLHHLLLHHLLLTELLLHHVTRHLLTHLLTHHPHLTLRFAIATNFAHPI